MSEPEPPAPHAFEDYPLTRIEYITGFYSVLLVAWLAKIHLHPTPAATPREALQRLGIGPFGGWAMLLMVGALYLAAVALAIWGVFQRGGLGEVHGTEKHYQSCKS